jgi:glucarate dehydratase
MLIREAVLTPVAFADPPLLNAMGVHEPFALRTVLQLICEDGVVGLGESYGDQAFLNQAWLIASNLAGTDLFDLPGIRGLVARALGQAPADDRGGFGEGRGLVEGAALGSRLAKLYSLFEVAALDAQGQYLGRPVVDLLGGPVRREVEFCAYLFYKYAAHLEGPDTEPDEWGEVLTPDALVEQARRMIDRYGFRSLKLKGGVLHPYQEINAARALAEAFPDHPLRMDPNGAWRVDTGIRVAEELDGVLEYLEDPTPGIEGMARVAERASMPLATNMCVVSYADIEPAFRSRAVGVVLADHHFWGGLRDTQALAVTCQAFGVGLSMHSNSHLGISLAAMVHLAAATPHLRATPTGRGRPAT